MQIHLSMPSPPPSLWQLRSAPPLCRVQRDSGGTAGAVESTARTMRAKRIMAWKARPTEPQLLVSCRERLQVCMSQRLHACL